MVNDFSYLFIVFGIVIISMTIHEVAHGFVSYWLGDYTAKLQGRLSLNPIKHIDPFMTLILPLGLAAIGAPVFGGAKPIPINPYALRWREWGMALVSIAGPATNILIAFVSFGLWSLLGYSSDGLVSTILTTSVSVNLGFFVFNMIPIPPLDGSRLLYALAPEFVQKAMESLEKYGIMLIFAIVLFFNNWFGLVMVNAINFIINIFVSLFSGVI